MKQKQEALAEFRGKLEMQEKSFAEKRDEL